MDKILDQPNLFKRSVVELDCFAVHQAMDVDGAYERIVSVITGTDHIWDIAALEYTDLVSCLCQEGDPADEALFAGEELATDDETIKCLLERCACHVEALDL